MSDCIICLGCGAQIEDICTVCDGPGVLQPIEVAATPTSPQSLSNEAPALRCSACGGNLKPGATQCTFCQATVSTVRCSHCLGWNLAPLPGAIGTHCGWCGQTLEHELRGDVTLPCPRCSKAMTSSRYRDLEVDECLSCGGLMLSPGMLDKLVSQRDVSTNMRLALPDRSRFHEQAVKYLNCPVCQKVMNRQQFGRMSGVIVDTCKQHGVWFDGGELHAVVQFVTRGGLERARERELQELKDAKRQAAVQQKDLSAELGRLEGESKANRIGQGGTVIGWIIDVWLR